MGIVFLKKAISFLGEIMSTVNAFCPKGKTYLVTTTAVQVSATDNCAPISYRIRNLDVATTYLAWAPADPTGAAVTLSAPTTPTAGNPQANVIGMFPESVEIFTLPPNAWFISGTANALEITPGEGI